jgi:hypothetical protein
MKLHVPVLALAASAALAGCYTPSAPDDVLYGAITATTYRPVDNFPANFAAYSNVLLNPTVTVIDDTNSGVSITAGVNDGVIAEIRSNLEARGYAVSTDAAAAGTGALKVAAYGLFSSVNLYYSSYWCSWYYYYYCYPTTGYAGSYNYGTLLIEAGDELQNPGQPPTPGTPSKLIWTSASYGVMAGGDAITVSSPGYPKVLGSIDQAFAQSPYFTTK